MVLKSNLLTLAQALLRAPSISPQDNGAIDIVIAALEPLGFHCEKLLFTGNNGPDTWNLFATRTGHSPGRHFCFAGHTDVVPTGGDADWSQPPFGGVVKDGILYGRGAVDMKGAIAAFIAAAAEMPEHPGTISLLITGNEEGNMVNGTMRVLEWLADQHIQLDHCLVGEPTSEIYIGDSLKNGRRGSFQCSLTVQGVQGHVAYPTRATNANHLLAQIVARFTTAPLDISNADFPASSLQVTAMQTDGETAVNLVPGQASAHINIRYNNIQTPETLTRWLTQHIDAVLVTAPGASYTLHTKNSGDAFLTPRAGFVDMICNVVAEKTGRAVTLSTGGGTSDARYIKNHCPVVELGLRGDTMHKIDECVPLADMEELAALYQHILRRYFGMPSE